MQSKLAYLESEHNISRRRVQELKLELEHCKKNVAKERMRVLQMEMEDVERQHAATMKAYTDQKGKGRASPSSPSKEDHARYREAVEEKKGEVQREACRLLLIGLLCSSQSTRLFPQEPPYRLTSELTSHSALFADLRTLRDADIEVLKGVVEEGLKERWMLRKRSVATVEEDQRLGDSAQAVLDAKTQQSSEEESEESSEESEDESIEDSISASRSLLIRPSPAADKTARTDYAIFGTQSQATRPFESITNLPPSTSRAATSSEPCSLANAAGHPPLTNTVIKDFTYQAEESGAGLDDEDGEDVEHWTNNPDEYFIVESDPAEAE